jgi:hypothetical protein
VNGSPATNRRRIEAEAVFELVFSELANREGKVLPGAGQIRKANRNEFGALVGSIFQDSLRVHFLS